MSEQSFHDQQGFLHRDGSRRNLNVCLGCLKRDGTFVNLSSCRHSVMLQKLCDVKVPKMELECLICYRCHAILKTIYDFKQQAEESLNMLWHNKDTATVRFLKLEKVVIVDDEIHMEHQPDYVTEDAAIKVESERLIDYQVEPTLDLHISSGTVSASECDEPLITLKQQDVEVPEIRKTVDGKRRMKKIKEMPKIVFQMDQNAKPNLNYEGILNSIILTTEELKQERETQLRSAKYIKLSHKCDLCIVGFDHAQSLKEHVESKHRLTKNSYQCDICMSVFNHRVRCKEHVRKHYVRYECAVCKKRAKNISSLLNHFNLHHKRTEQLIYSCHLCDFTTVNYRSYTYHREKHKGRVQCKQCVSSFVNKAGLKCHMLTAHETAVKAYKCIECNKTYRARSGLAAHNAAKHSSPSNAVVSYCESCKITFKTENLLKQHLKRHINHRKESDRKFTCDMCQEKFFEKSKLKEHIEWSHLNMKEFPCHLCDKIFRKVILLNKHVKRVHERMRPPRDKVCHFCGKAFMSSITLICHIRSHTGERPLKCKHCPATFAHPGALYTHTKLLHTPK